MTGFLDAALTRERKIQVGAPRCNGLVSLVHAALAKERLIGIARGGLGGKQHQPCGVAVNAVDRDQLVQPQIAFEAYQHRFLQVLARRRDRQEVRLVHDDQVFVLMQDDFFKRNGLFRFKRPVVIHADVALKRARFSHQRAEFIHHLAARHALQPRLTRDGRKALNQKVGDGGPRPFRQAHATGANTVARGQHGWG